MSDVLSKNIPTTEELLMMFIKVGYSQTGKVNKSTALAMMRYVNNDSELQNKVNQGNNAAILKHKPVNQHSEIINKQSKRISELESLIRNLLDNLEEVSLYVGEDGMPSINPEEFDSYKEAKRLLAKRGVR